jgi:trans-aconitate 2-methyltransferase
MAWDPDHYLRFADQRARPGIELLARIANIDARRIVDLGCGTGDLTALVARRWPESHIVGIDAAPEMIERARASYPGGTWAVGDITTWMPDAPVDVIFSNAALHWLDDHPVLFRRLRNHLTSRGVLAVQMPDNWSAPTHRIPAEILDSGDWPAAARTALLRDRLSPVDEYTRWLQPASVDAWRTTYYHHLTGSDAVWAWVTGSLLRPVLANLSPEDREHFSAECRDRYRRAYPVGVDGTVTVPFSRLFLVAQVAQRARPREPSYSST